MTILWLIVWLVKDTPSLHQWNNWLIALIICAVLDLSNSSIIKISR